MVPVTQKSEVSLATQQDSDIVAMIKYNNKFLPF